MQTSKDLMILFELTPVLTLCDRKFISIDLSTNFPRMLPPSTAMNVPVGFDIVLGARVGSFQRPGERSFARKYSTIPTGIFERFPKFERQKDLSAARQSLKCSTQNLDGITDAAFYTQILDRKSHVTGHSLASSCGSLRR